MTEQNPPTSGERSSRGAYAVLGVTFGLSTLLAVFFFAQYSAVLSYVRETVDEREEPFPWDNLAFAPEECVDHALEWTAECLGIKSMCDMYVDQVMAACMESGDREAYCEALGERTMTTEFGAEECFARGTRRNVDAEPCANAYRFIDSYCTTILSEDAAAAEGSG